MNYNLLLVLLEKNVIRVETEIDAKYRGRDISGTSAVEKIGTFIIFDINRSGDDVIFVAADTRDGSRRNITASDIVMIDGMEPERLAEVYGINARGERMKEGKRRGRKSKATLAALAAQREAETGLT